MRLNRRLFAAFILVTIFPVIISFAVLTLLSKITFGQNGSDVLTKASVEQYIEIIVLLIIAALVITAAAVAFWINKILITPINALIVATKKIRDGDLSYEIEVPHQDDEIEDLCNDFENMRKQLKYNVDKQIRDDERQRELISNITHDLKTPLTTIRGYAEGIVDGVATTQDQIMKYAETISIKATQMSRLIDELTFYTKIDSNDIPYEFQKISIMDLIKECIANFELELVDNNIEFVYEERITEDVYVYGDPKQLSRVIYNIVNNSIKYVDNAKAKHIIKLKVEAIGSNIQIVIKDNGIGIQKSECKNIFNRFYRSDKARSNVSAGSGIGLSIVKKIIEDHSGKVWADSDMGEGTSIYIALRKYEDVENEQDINCRR